MILSQVSRNGCPVHPLLWFVGFPEEGKMAQRLQILLLCRRCQHSILTAPTVDVRDQPQGFNPELLKSLFSLCLKWE